MSSIGQPSFGGYQAMAEFHIQFATQFRTDFEKNSTEFALN